MTISDGKLFSMSLNVLAATLRSLEIKTMSATMTATTQSAPSEPKLYSTRETAERLGVSTRTLWTLTNIGEISSVRIGRAVRYSVQHIQEFIDRNTTH